MDAQSCYFREWYHATCCSRCAGSGGGEWCISWKRYRYGGESCRTDGAIGYQSVSDTINQFKRLKDDPVNAAKSLDNELHFLTATQLEQIRVLGEQGRSSDAARIAMSALAEETGRRTADIDNNLNALGSTLQTLSDWWKQFWDAAMNIGREDSLDAQIATLQEKVSRAKRLPGRHHLLRLNTISSVLTIFRRKNARRICRMQKSRQSGIIRSNRNAVMLKMLH